MSISQYVFIYLSIAYTSYKMVHCCIISTPEISERQTNVSFQKLGHFSPLENLHFLVFLHAFSVSPITNHFPSRHASWCRICNSVPKPKNRPRAKVTGTTWTCSNTIAPLSYLTSFVCRFVLLWIEWLFDRALPAPFRPQVTKAVGSKWTAMCFESQII